MIDYSIFDIIHSAFDLGQGMPPALDPRKTNRMIEKNKQR